MKKRTKAKALRKFLADFIYYVRRGYSFRRAWELAGRVLP
jgi:hypothetical protein